MATQDGRGQTVLRGKGNASLGKGSSGGYGNTVNTAGGASSGSVTSGADGGGRTGSSSAGISGNRQVAAGSFSARLTGLEARLSLMEMGQRASQLTFSSMLDGNLKVLDLEGELKMKIGIQSDGKPGVSYHAGVAPPRPSPPSVSSRQLSYVVGWDGTFVDATPRPSDFARIDVHVGYHNDFEPDGTTAVGSLLAEGVLMLPGDIEDYWVRLVAVSAADVPSAPTDAVFVRPLPATAIAAESIAAVHLAAEIILSSTIVAGNPSGAHLEMNATGLRMVRADMTPTVVFSADEGNALITGSIQTALAGSGKDRIVFNPFPDRDWNEIRFYAPDDLTWSSLFATKDKGNKAGALGVQGFQNFDSGTVMASIYGQSSILTGVFPLTAGSADGTIAMTDGLLVSTGQTALVGGGGPWMIHNYKRPQPGANPAAGTRDPFVGFMDTATSVVNGTSVLEFHEQTDIVGGNMHIAGIRNLGTDLGVYWGDEGPDDRGFVNWYGRVAFKAYDFRSPETYTPIAVAGLATTSSENLKTDITPLGEHVDVLDAFDAVDPVRFRFKNPVSNGDPVRTMWVPDLVSDDPHPDHQPTAELAAAREAKTEDGYIPVELPPKPPRGPQHYYGLLAEEVEAVAPDAIVYGGAGPMIDQSSMNGLLWAAVKALSEKVAALEASGS
jgi:hypothetical protein